MRYIDIYRAWQSFVKGKKYSTSIDEFAYYVEQNLQQLTRDTETRTYKHGSYKRVVISEKKRRDLAVASVRDRVVHRYVYDELVGIFDNSFEPDVFSCREGKGLHKALVRTQKLLQKYYECYVWRADITKFFDYVDQDKLLSIIVRKIDPNSELFWLCEQIIQSYNSKPSAISHQPSAISHQPSAGIPIGNLTSQIFANIYLNEFDRYVRHRLKPLAYLRYGDDFILICKTRKQAYEQRLRSKEFLQTELGLSLHQTNDVVVAVKQGLHFLGHVITSKFLVVDKQTSKIAVAKVSIKNVASYRSLLLLEVLHEEINWELLQIIDKICSNDVY
jgi:retron-type reverse transcriptase